MIYIVAEHNGIALKNFLIQKSKENGIEIIDLYEREDSEDDYPIVAKILAEKMKKEEGSFGIAICGSGQGINMAMNRYPWIRSSLPVSVHQAQKTREHNNSNCLSIGAKELESELAFEMLKAFILAPNSTEERHIRRVVQLSQHLSPE
jgi:ribose 5-phosphate isomerase B